jgi:hypothetical protein
VVILAAEWRADELAAVRQRTYSKGVNMHALTLVVAPVAIHVLVRRKITPPTVDGEGITLAQVGRVEELLAGEALVRWIVSDETGVHWRRELEVVPVANLERAEAPE